MCNSRGIKDEDDRSSATSTIDYSKIALKCIPSKIGRKGDPRMHKALEARLNDPKLSLFEALKIGGFVFHWEDDVSYDEDHVLLSQRKNQLSRRIRLYKQNHEKSKMGGFEFPASATSVVRSEVSTKRKTDNDGAKPKRKPRNSDGGEARRKNKMKKAASSPDPLSTPSSQHGLNQECGSLDHEAVATTDSLSSMSGSVDGNQANGSKASFNSNAFPEAVSLNRRNSASQFALYGSSVLQGTNGNAANLPQDMTPSVITSSASIPSNLSRAERMNQALSMFSRDSSTLMQKCLLQAGFSPDQIESTKETYIEFGERALDNERMQLQDLKMKLNMNHMNVNHAPAPPFVPANQIQIPQIVSHSQPNSNLIQNGSREQFGMRELTMMQQPNNNAPLLQQQNISNIYFNNRNQQQHHRQQQVNNFHTTAMLQHHQHQLNNLRTNNVMNPSNIVDFKDTLEDEEWKSILHGSEHTLDKILGLTR